MYKNVNIEISNPVILYNERISKRYHCYRSGFTNHRTVCTKIRRSELSRSIVQGKHHCHDGERASIRLVDEMQRACLFLSTEIIF